MKEREARVVIKVTGKEKALKDLESAKKLIEEAGKILYRLPLEIGLEVEVDQEQTTSVLDNKSEGKKAALINHILEECEKQGLTIEEVREVEYAIRRAIQAAENKEIEGKKFKMKYEVWN